MMTDHPEFAEFISEGGTLGDTLTNLITEIQKLREEVKRWHEVRDYILVKSSYPTIKKLNLKDLLNIMEEVSE